MPLIPIVYWLWWSILVVNLVVNMVVTFVDTAIDTTELLTNEVNDNASRL